MRPLLAAIHAPAVRVHVGLVAACAGRTPWIPPLRRPSQHRASAGRQVQTCVAVTSEPWVGLAWSIRLASPGHLVAGTADAGPSHAVMCALPSSCMAPFGGLQFCPVGRGGPREPPPNGHVFTRRPAPDASATIIASGRPCRRSPRHRTGGQLHDGAGRARRCVLQGCPARRGRGVSPGAGHLNAVHFWPR